MHTRSVFEHTTIPDGWSRDADGRLRIPTLQAFQAFGALKHDPDNAAAYAVNFKFEAAMRFPEFLAANGIEIGDGEDTQYTRSNS